MAEDALARKEARRGRGERGIAKINCRRARARARGLTDPRSIRAVTISRLNDK